MVFDVELDIVCECFGSVKGVSYDMVMWSLVINICNNVIIDVGVGFE